MPLDPYLAERLHLLDGVARPFEGPEDPRSRERVLVVSVDHRLARDGVRFPGPVDDVVDVWAWLHADPDRPPGRTVVGGASAGASLAEVSRSLDFFAEALRG
jgi:hypothetical protein